MSNVDKSIKAKNARWSFAGDVAGNFDDHVNRSIPFYLEGHDLVAGISDFFVHNGSVIYEIGCATGELTARLAHQNEGKACSIIAIDVEPEMVSQAQEKCAGLPNVMFETNDIVDMSLDTADLIVAYYTMQFIQPAFRQAVYNKVYNALNWGGGFILFEKVRAPDARFQDMMTALYTDFKLDRGFSETEIINKSRSLKGVLEPFSTKGNLDFLGRAGFVDVMSVFKYASFEGFLAIK